MRLLSTEGATSDGDEQEGFGDSPFALSFALMRMLDPKIQNNDRILALTSRKIHNDRIRHETLKVKSVEKRALRAS